MLKLPIGIQTLRHIIDGGYAYVDKTALAYQLIDQGKYYFLSRPRRFGKSLFIDTLKEIFEGNKRLFTDLYIADKWNFEDTYPVIRLSFGAGTWKTVDEMHRSVQWALQWEGKTLGVQIPEGLNYKEQFDALIRLTREQYSKEVVVLIDEYDKPILDNITDKDIARAIRDDIKNLYATIKDNDANIRFVFITGVSKFSKLNLFSGLNNLNDITLSPAYGDICGYTHTDITTTFGPHFEDVDMEKVKEWYNGYNYFGEKVYNPFDILLFLANDKVFKSYWWTTGNTTFLIDLIRAKSYTIPELENYEATDAMLDSFDVDTIELAALLWQTGYLTIKDTATIGDRVTYRLGVPNKEIQLSLNDFFIDVFTEQKSEKISYQHQLHEMLTHADIDGLQQTLFTLFATIPYQHFTNNNIAHYEGYYASVIYAYMASLGFDITAEDTTQKGSIDLSLKLADKCYIFEFKAVAQAKGQALVQIKEKKYFEKYIHYPNLYLIGIEFGKTERNMVQFAWERFDKQAYTATNLLT